MVQYEAICAVNGLFGRDIGDLWWLLQQIIAINTIHLAYRADIVEFKRTYVMNFKRIFPKPPGAQCARLVLKHYKNILKLHIYQHICALFCFKFYKFMMHNDLVQLHLRSALRASLRLNVLAHLHFELSFTNTFGFTFAMCFTSICNVITLHCIYNCTCKSTL